MMTKETAQKLALGYCMQGCGRYLECLVGVVRHMKDHLPKDFVDEVTQDYKVYLEKMLAAGLPVSIVNVGEQGG